jgi:esterase
MRTLITFSLCILLAACYTAPKTIARSWELPAGVKSVQINGYEMAYVERGTGVPVVLVHGSGLDYRYFAAQMDAFAAQYRVISLSLRHHHPEPWRGEGEYGLNQHASDLVTFIRALEAGPVHLVGHSRGGTAALYATRLAPALVRSLTFAEGGAGMSAFAPEDPAVRDRRAIAFRAMSDKLSKGDTDGGLEVFMEYVNGPGAWKSAPEGTKQVLRDNAWTLASGEADTATWTLFTCDDAKRLRTPVLLLGGDGSPPNFAATLDKVQTCLSGPERQVIPRSGHAMPRANPNAFNEAVMSFIARH